MGNKGVQQEPFQAPVLLKNTATFAAQILQGKGENIYTMFLLIGKPEALWGPWNLDKSLLHPPSMLHNCLLSITVLCVLHKLQPTSFMCLHSSLCCYIAQISLQWVEFGRQEVHKTIRGMKENKQLPGTVVVWAAKIYKTTRWQGKQLAFCCHLSVTWIFVSQNSSSKQNRCWHSKTPSHSSLIFAMRLQR